MPNDKPITSTQEKQWTSAWQTFIKEGKGNPSNPILLRRAVSISQLQSFFAKDTLGADTLVLRIYCAAPETPVKGFEYVPDLVLVKGTPCAENTSTVLHVTAYNDPVATTA